MTRLLCDALHGHLLGPHDEKCRRCSKPRGEILCNRQGHPKQTGRICWRCGRPRWA